MAIRRDIWTQAKEISLGLKDWMALPFGDIRVKMICSSATHWMSALAGLRQNFPEEAILKALQLRVNDFLDLCSVLLPVVDAAVEPEHWRVLFAALGRSTCVTVVKKTPSVFFSIYAVR